MVGAGHTAHLRAGERASGNVRLMLLGGFELSSPQGRVELSTSAKRLVTFLALGERPLPRAYVAGSLWPHVCEERAGANLRSAVWRTRQAYPVIEATADCLGVTRETAVDVIELVAAARRLGDGCDAPMDTNAARHFADELLPGWYDDWVLVWRERWRQIRLHALEALAARFTAAGEFARAVETGLQAVRTEPLRESAHRAVIAAHLAEGNLVEAARHYHTCRRLFDEELGVRPSPLLQELVRPILGTRVNATVTGW